MKIFQHIVVSPAMKKYAYSWFKTYSTTKHNSSVLEKIVGISELRTMYICSTIISSRVIVDTNDFFLALLQFDKKCST